MTMKQTSSVKQETSNQVKQEMDPTIEKYKENTEV